MHAGTALVIAPPAQAIPPQWCLWPNVNRLPPLTYWQKCCWVSLASVPAWEGRRWNEEVACLLAQILSGYLVQLVYSHWIPLGNADSFTLHFGSSCSQTGIGQLFIVRSCHAELPVIYFWCDSFSCFLHLPAVPQPLIMKLYVGYQRHSRPWRIHTAVSGCCEEEPGAVTSSSSCRLANPPLPLDVPPLPLGFP